MTRHKAPYQPKPRTTLPLGGTTSRIELKLDHTSELAIAWARQWLKSGPPATGVDALASGVVRRALAVYIQHLQQGDLDAPQEARAVRSACSPSKPDEEDREAAWVRLREHQPGRPFPTFADVLHGPHRAAEWAAFNSRVDAMVDQITRESPPRTSTTR